MSGEAIPKARIRRRRLFRLVWVVPAIALVVAAWLVWQHMRAIGPEIKIRFPDASGLRVGQTPVNYRGVQVGEVIGIDLTEDRRQAVVKARLRKSAAPLATEGTQFWIVRPQIGLNQVTGLSNMLSGPEINLIPGKSETLQSEFAGLESAPTTVGMAGLRLVLRAERPKGVRVNTPVNYRGVEVGTVHKIELAPNSASADIHVLIHNRYASLVRAGSAFWNTSGITATGGILKGIEVELESLRTLYTGAIEFATPSENAPRVKPGTVFFLHDKAKDEWLAWSAKIPLGGAPEKTAQQKAGPDAATGDTKTPAKEKEKAAAEKPAQQKSGRPAN
jgi:paraquat-inducible protein B